MEKMSRLRRKKAATRRREKGFNITRTSFLTSRFYFIVFMEYFQGGLEEILLRVWVKEFLLASSETRFTFSPFGCLSLYSLIHLSNSKTTIICFK